MNIDDFINSFSFAIDKQNKHAEHRSHCMDSMLIECIEASCLFFPKKENELKQYIIEPGEEMEWNFRVIYELTSNLISHYDENPTEPYLHRDLKPIMRSTGASSDEINEILALIPTELHNKSRSLLIEFDKKNEEIENYAFAIHNALKKVVVEFFPQIFDLPSRGLRELDSELFWLKDEIVDLILTKID